MKLRVIWISAKGRSKQPAYDALTREYVGRIARYHPIEASDLPSQSALLKLLDRSAGRTVPALVLLDSRGPELTSEEFAEFIRSQQVSGVQQLVFAIGPPDGLSDEAHRRAKQTISLGKMTLPHELARVVLLEQLYRAFTILEGHPYHCGH